MELENLTHFNIKEWQLFSIFWNKYYFKNENWKTTIYTDYNDKVTDLDYMKINKSITHWVKESYWDYILAEVETENNIDFNINYIYYDRVWKMFYGDFPWAKSFDKPCEKTILKQGWTLECFKYWEEKKEEEEKEEEKKEEKEQEPTKTEEVKNEEEQQQEPIKIEGQVFKDLETLNLEFKYKEFKNGENLFIVRDDTDYQNYMINKINEFTTFTYFTIFFIFIFLSFYLIKTLLWKRNF